MTFDQVHKMLQSKIDINKGHGIDKGQNLDKMHHSALLAQLSAPACLNSSWSNEVFIL